MKQLIPFNQSIAGTVHNFCLDNVRRGFGIDNKYASAWEAWQHTEQHPDRNLPDGLDVPLFYSYTADIDGVTANYGHINVRLANGTVWSDGTIYANIDAYLANHWPKYVGWGESVNDFKIIEGETEMPLTEANLYSLIRGIEGREPTHDEMTTKAYYDDPNTAIETFWNNGGQARYENGMGREAMGEMLQAAIGRAAVTDDEFNKYKLDPKAFADYLLAVQQEHHITPSTPTPPSPPPALPSATPDPLPTPSEPAKPSGQGTPQPTPVPTPVKPNSSLLGRLINWLLQLFKHKSIK